MAVDYNRIARDIAFTLEVKSPKIFENIFLNNGCLFMFGSKGRVNIIAGGNRFDERTRLGKNTNVGHRAKTATIPTDYQNNVQTAYYGQSVVSGATVVNMVEEDQNAGPARISSLADDCLDELLNTFPNEVGDKIMATSESGTSPLSLVVQLPATAYGSQTITTGGIVRSDYPGSDPTAAWQTRYSSPATAVDLAAAAGIAAFSNFLWTCSPGGSAITEQPDLALCRTGVMSQASGGGDVNRRYSINDKMLKFNFDNIMFNSATLIADRNAVANAILCVNTNYAHIQVLGSGKTKQAKNVKVIGDGAVSVPLRISQPVESFDALQYSIKAWLTYNLTFGGLRQHGRLANVTEA